VFISATAVQNRYHPVLSDFRIAPRIAWKNV